MLSSAKYFPAKAVRDENLTPEQLQARLELYLGETNAQETFEEFMARRTSFWEIEQVRVVVSLGFEAVINVRVTTQCDGIWMCTCPEHLSRGYCKHTTNEGSSLTIERISFVDLLSHLSAPCLSHSLT